MPREPRFLTGIEHAPQRHRDHRVGSTLVEELVLARLLSALGTRNLERLRLASFSQPPVRRKHAATASVRSSYDFCDLPEIGFVWQNGSRPRLEGARRIAAACAERSQSSIEGTRAGDGGCDAKRSQFVGEGFSAN